MKKHSFRKEKTLILTSNGYSQIFNKWFMLLLMVVFAAGCKKVTEEPGLAGVCPKVISTNPVDTASGVSLNKTIDATFNEAMNPSTINTATFRINNND